MVGLGKHRRFLSARRGTTTLNALVAIGVIALLAFPIVSRLAANVQPIPPTTAITLSSLHAIPSRARLDPLPMLTGMTRSELSDIVQAGPAGETRAINQLVEQLYGPQAVLGFDRVLAGAASSRAVAIPPLPRAAALDSAGLARSGARARQRRL